MAKPSSYTDAPVVTALTAAAAANGGTDFKALVCVFMFGANDSHNTVMPLAGNPARVGYDLYRSDQTNVGIPVGQAPTNTIGASWRLHHNLAALKSRWDAGKLGVLMNVGTLQEPTSKAQYQAGSVVLPDQLFAHNLQQAQWQALLPAKEQLLHGWFGRAADLAASYYNPAPYSGLLPAFSVSGQQIQLTGYESRGNDTNTTGVVTETANNAFNSDINSANRLYDAKRRSARGNILEDLRAARIASAISTQANIAAQLQSLPATPDARFTAVPNNGFAQQLKTVARIIYSRTQFAMRRQLFFVTVPGSFDHHASLRASHDPLMTTLDEGLDVFWQALGDLGDQSKVVVFTESDFGRALVQNGSQGVDHGWGGHHFILGGSVAGGIYGDSSFQLTSDGPNDVGQGRLLPTTSVDQYAATMLKWWGIPEQYLHLVIPNLPKFSPAVIPGLLP